MKLTLQEAQLAADKSERRRCAWANVSLTPTEPRSIGPSCLAFVLCG